MKVQLKNNAFVVLKGTDVHTFLKGVSTLNTTKLNENSASWGACLTPQGKIMYTFVAFQYNEAVYLHTAENSLMDFGAWLSKYSLNMQVNFSIGKNIAVYADTRIKGELGRVSEECGVVKIIDPRHSVMGALLYSFGGKDINVDANLEEYHAYRIQNSVVDFFTDFIPNKSFALECLMDMQNGVHFDKGCYIGQEVTARMHFKGGGKKHLMAFRTQNILYAVGEDIINVNGKVVGTVLSTADGYIMAMVRTMFVDGDSVETEKGVIHCITP